MLQLAHLQRFIFLWVYYTNSTKLRWRRVYYIIDFRQLLSKVGLKYLERGRLRFDLGWGRVYEIVRFRQLLSVKPARTFWIYNIKVFQML